MADFTRLYVSDGVGDYHLNSFRIAFEPPANGKSAAALAGDLIDNFPNYLKSNFATVEFDRVFDGKKTLQFHGSAARYALSGATAVGRTRMVRPQYRIHGADAEARVLRGRR